LVSSRKVRQACRRVEKYLKMLVGKPEEKRSLGRPKRRWRIILKWIV
jgi:hypothetical protein